MDKQDRTAYVTYREDRNDHRKQKAIIIPKDEWEENWLRWWYRRGAVVGNSHRDL